MGFGYGPIPTAVQTNTAAPTGTASATLVMAGLAGAITPSVTGRMLFMVSGNMANNTTNDGCKVQLSYGTGGAPSNGGALTGTQTGTICITTQDLTGADKCGFAIQSWVSTLTVGTTYWLDVAFAAITGGTASLTDVTITALEM